MDDTARTMQDATGRSGGVDDGALGNGFAAPEASQKGVQPFAPAQQVGVAEPAVAQQSGPQPYAPVQQAGMAQPAGAQLAGSQPYAPAQQSGAQQSGPQPFTLTQQAGAGFAPTQDAVASQPQILPTSGLAIAGMVLGIIALATCLIPILNIGSPVIAIIGLVLSAVSLSGINKGLKKGRGIAIAGIVLCAIVTVVALLISAACSAAFTNESGKSSVDSSQAALTEGPTSTSAAPASEAAAFSGEKAKANFVGTWDMIWFKDDKHNLDEDYLQAARENGADSYMDLNEDGTGLLVIGDNKTEFAWEPTSETSVAYNSDSLSGSFALNDGVLTMGNSKKGASFRKGQPRQTPPASSGDVQPSAAASTDTQRGQAEPGDTQPSAASETTQQGQAEAGDEAADQSGQEASTDGAEAEPAGEVDPDLKEMLDSYESFMDEYIEFMQNYQNSDDVMGMMQDYSDYLQRYTDFMQKVERVDTENMSAADYAYYIEVTSRVSQKLLAVSGL